VLLITPESLESQFINHGRHLRRIYSEVQYVVIDELHAFLEDVRGVHLRSLLARLRHASGASPRMLGLSATLGDFTPARRFLCSADPTKVKVLTDDAGERQLRVALKAFQRPESRDTAGEEDLTVERAIAEDVAIRFRKGTNLIFCNSRALSEELADLLNEKCCEESWPVNPFLVHHGSLSRELREDAEADLKKGSEVTVLCTSTLEMGIDIGAVQCVGQIGAPWRVSSLAQRVGRSGRREGETQTLRMYTIDRAITEESTLTDRLFPSLLRSVAMIELLKRKWVETPMDGRRNYSTFIHQLLSILRQTGGINAGSAHNVLCSEGAFSTVSQTDCVAILRHLRDAGVVQQIETGEIILARNGERIVEARDFYAAFISAQEYSVEHQAQKIGTMPLDVIPPEGEHLILGGRRWSVDHVDHAARKVSVIPAKGRKKPMFMGGVGQIAAEVMFEMKRHLSSCDPLPYLHSTATDALSMARMHYQKTGLSKSPVFESPRDISLLPWAGSKIHETLKLFGVADGLQVELSLDGLCLVYKGVSTLALRDHLNGINKGGIEADALAMHVPSAEVERFDELVPPSLLLQAYVDERLDILGARRAAGELAREIT
jgi:ATP-dependent Lhr-like helicase